MAREAKRLGMKTLIDFHYSDDWADPQHQVPPAAWKGYGEKQLAEAVYRHTKDTVRKLADQGTPADMVQIGNEVRDGMVWPIGQISKSGYGPFANLLKAGVKGARDGARGRRLLIMVHHDKG